MSNQLDVDATRIVNRTDLSYFANKRVLVTGGSGLIGVNLLSTLSKLRGKGNSPELIHAISKSGQFPVKFDKSVEIIKLDLTDYRRVSQLRDYDFIFHSAGYGQPGKFLANPFQTIAINVTATEQLIHKVSPTGKIVFMSTSEVYSGLSNPPFREEQIGTTTTEHFRAAYIESKRTGETLVDLAHKSLGIEGVSLRLALAYGPGTKNGDQRVLNSFIHQALSDKVIRLKDQGEAWRTYCYVADAVQMCLNAALFGGSGLFNIGGVSRIQILELAKLIASLTKADFELPKDVSTIAPGAPDDVWLDLKKVSGISKAFDYMNIEEGLNRTIEWQKSYLMN
jgi:UDP-glucuronate decarboxylase